MNGFKFLFLVLIFCSCAEEEEIDQSSPETEQEEMTPMPCDSLVFNFQNEQGCDGQYYNDPNIFNYVIPFPEGTECKMGLCNCSSSYHAAGEPDEYAFDFDLPNGTHFTAAKGGKVVKVVEDQSSAGGGTGNFVVIDHLDGTFGHYLHSPENGILVENNTYVSQGDTLGLVGRSGLAGYDHLHFIVSRGGYEWPYNGIPISFSNVIPPHVVLQSFSTYVVCKN